MRETYFAQVEDRPQWRLTRRRGQVLWVGQDLGEVATLEEFERILAPYATPPPEVREKLKRDRLDDLLGLRT